MWASRTKALKKEISTLKEQLEDLKLKKKMEEREIEQLVKMKEEKNKLERDQCFAEIEKKFQDKEFALRRELQDQEQGMRTEHYQQMLKKLEEFRKEINDFSKEMLKRLPNVRMEIKERRTKR